MDSKLCEIPRDVYRIAIWRNSFKKRSAGANKSSVDNNAGGG